MTRRVTSAIAIVMLLLLVVIDYAANPPNPYRQPAIVALGSGAVSEGGSCGSLPE